MARKYLDDIGVTNMPDSWGKSKDERQSAWKEDRKLYGFDERETWSLDFTFFLWLYEHLKMYLERAMIKMDVPRIEYEGKEYTQGQMIERLLSLLEGYFQNNNDWTDSTHEIGKIWAKILPLMWW